jgi:ABC-type glycerol-3-phosphate transport system substrate-binding protein
MKTKRDLTRRQVLVGGGALLGAAAATVPAAPALAQKVKIQWIEWLTPEISEATMQQVLNAFYQTDAGKSIEVVRQSMPFGQVHDKIITLNLAGQVPDVVTVHPPFAPGLADQGVLEPLDEYLQKAGKEWTANLFQALMTPWKGHVYNVVLTAGALHLYYNERKLAEAGLSAPPKTWAEVEAMSPKLTNPARNTYAFASGMAAKSPYDGGEKDLFPLIYQTNEMLIKGGKANLNSAGAVKALKYWLRLVTDLKVYAPGVLTNMGKDKNEAFMGEQVAMVGNHPAHITIVQQRNPGLKFGVAPLPEGDTHGTIAAGWTLGIGRGSRQKEAAWEFIRWLTGPEGCGRVAIAAKQLPGNSKADVSELFQKEPRLKVSAAVLAKGRAFAEPLPEAINLYRILVEQIHEAANKRKTPEQAMEFAAAEWNKVLAKYS